MAYNVKNPNEIVRTGVASEVAQEIKSVDPGDAQIFGSVSLSSTTAAIIANDDTNESYASVIADSSAGFGMLALEGGVNLRQEALTVDFSTLTAGNSKFYVNFEPTTDVTVNASQHGTFIVIENDCGANFDLVPNGGETFNGAASYTLVNGKTYLLVNANSGKYLVLGY